MSAGDVAERRIAEMRAYAKIGAVYESAPGVVVAKLARMVREAADDIEASRAEVAALRRQVEELRAAPSPDVVTVPREEWTVAQILANAWRRHPLTCGERDKLVAEWDALRSGEAEQKQLAQVEAEAEEEKGRKA